MAGLMADYDAELQRPVGVSSSRTSSGTPISILPVLPTSNGGGGTLNVAVPTGATLVEVYGLGGGGDADGSHTGGGGAFAQSTVAVIGGDTLVCNPGTAGANTPGGASSVTYKGRVVMSAAGGGGGFGSAGVGGRAVNCTFTTRAYDGGSPAPAMDPLARAPIAIIGASGGQSSLGSGASGSAAYAGWILLVFYGG